MLELRIHEELSEEGVTKISLQSWHEPAMLAALVVFFSGRRRSFSHCFASKASADQRGSNALMVDMAANLGACEWVLQHFLRLASAQEA